MEIYRRLRQDHAWQRELANLILWTTEEHPDRQRLFSRFSSELKAHITAEERSLYGISLCLPNCHLMARRGIYGHQQILDGLRTLENMPLASGEWLSSFDRLRNEFEHYTRDEEEFLFPAARDSLGYSTGVRLAKIYSDLMSDCLTERNAGMRPPVEPVPSQRENSM